MSHLFNFALDLNQFREIGLQIEIFFKILRYFQLFLFGLRSQAASDVPISINNKGKDPPLQILMRKQPLVELFENSIKLFRVINFLLRYSSIFLAKLCQFRIEFRTDILVEEVKISSFVTVNYSDCKLYNLCTGFYLPFLKAGRLKTQSKKIPEIRFLILSWKVEFNNVYLLLRKGCSMIFSYLDTDISDIFDIIDSAVMPSFMFQSQLVQHGHHAM